MPENPDDFFIGWAAKPAPAFLRSVTVLFVGISVVIAAGTSALQRTITSSRWDFTVRDYEGVFLAEPSPLLVELVGGEVGRLHHLVREAKYGLRKEDTAPFHLRRVTLRASELGDGTTTMLEVLRGSIREVGESSHPFPGDTAAREVVVQGEIVDSKCYLGAMNPGIGKPHRACAIHCLRGGVPPVLLVRDAAGATVLYLLTGPGGEALGETILDVVAEPIEVAGVLHSVGPLAVLAINPAAIRRL